jgi:hypothetical protein
MPRWECSECGTWVDRPQRPVRCRRCKLASAVFVAADDSGVADTSEAMFEHWVRHGMRTMRHWRARPSRRASA